MKSIDLQRKITDIVVLSNPSRALKTAADIITLIDPILKRAELYEEALGDVLALAQEEYETGADVEGGDLVGEFGDLRNRIIDRLREAGCLPEGYAPKPVATAEAYPPAPQERTVPFFGAGAGLGAGLGALFRFAAG